MNEVGQFPKTDDRMLLLTLSPRAVSSSFGISVFTQVDSEIRIVATTNSVSLSAGEYAVQFPLQQRDAQPESNEYRVGSTARAGLPA